MTALQRVGCAGLAIWLHITSTMAAAVNPRDVAPYLNPSLPPPERAADLLDRMTWEEKIGQLGGVRRAFGTSTGKPTFNRSSFETVHATQNGQVGASVSVPLINSNEIRKAHALPIASISLVIEMRRKDCQQ